MNVCVFYYDGFCEFEVVLAVNQFRENNIFSAALENRVYISEEKQKFLPDKTIQELNPDDIDLFIIPGGDSTILYEKAELREFISKLNKKLLLNNELFSNSLIINLLLTQIIYIYL